MSDDWINEFIEEMSRANVLVDLRRSRFYPEYVILHLLVVPKDQRRRGLGTNAMQRLIRAADEHRDTLALTPSGDFGASVRRLQSFYRRFGFRPSQMAAQYVNESYARPSKAL